MSEEREPRIKVMENGPYQVSGANLIKMEMALNAFGHPIEWERGPLIGHGEQYELCRCGASSNKPFCDGNHTNIGFRDNL